MTTGLLYKKGLTGFNQCVFQGFICIELNATCSPPEFERTLYSRDERLHLAFI